MKFVQTMGMVWRLSDRNFKKLAKDMKASGGGEDLDDYGKLIIGRLYNLDEVVHEVEDNG